MSMNLTSAKQMKRAIIVDDEVEITQLLADELESNGIACVCAPDGKTALALVQEFNPDLVISDYRMPGLNGIELIRFMKDLGIAVPIIWLSGHADDATFREAWRLGVFDFFRKPFDLNEVVSQAIEATSGSPEKLAERRPRFLDSAQFKKVSVDLEQGFFDRLQAQCFKEGKSISSFIVAALEKEMGRE